MEWEYITPNRGAGVSLNFVFRSAPADGITGIQINFLHIAVHGGHIVSLCLNLGADSSLHELLMRNLHNPIPRPQPQML